MGRLGGLFSYGDLNTLISEDEGGVGRCQLSGRHCECRIVCGLRDARKQSRVSREVIIDCRRCQGWRLVDGVRGGSPPPIFLCELRCPENLFSAGFGRYVPWAPTRTAGWVLSSVLGLTWGGGGQALDLGAYRLACWQPHPELSPWAILPPATPTYRTGTVHSIPACAPHYTDV